MDKKNILNVLTYEWQTTYAIAKKLNTGHNAILGGIYELLIDDKKIERMKIKNVTYWRKVKNGRN